jgi:D-arabinose 1-dehydrogenase-like Zn-dependent alcohol dehydrogenase
VLDAPDALGMPVPFTLGHENAGWVDAIGPGVHGFEPGEAVALYGIIACGQCRACLDGRDNECRRVAPGGIGLGRDGGMAEFVVAPARQLLPIGDLDMAATGGDVAIVGSAGGALPVGFGALPLEVRVTVPFWGTRAEFAEVIALARAGRISAHVERFPLSDAAAAYAKLRAGEVRGRAVVMPDAVFAQGRSRA